MELENFIQVYESVPPAYYEWMFDVFRACLQGPVLETGSGPGIITRLLLDKGFTVTGVDVNEEILKRLRKQFQDTPDRFAALQADIARADLAALPGAPFGTVLCLNLLEHIDDDLAALWNMERALKPGGRLIVLVPAHPWLYGSMDEMFGHRRRYRRSELESKMKQTGLGCQARYFNLAGVPGWWWRFKVCRSKSFSPFQTGIYRRMLPLIRRLESGITIPTGLSLIAIGEKNAATVR